MDKKKNFLTVKGFKLDLSANTSAPVLDKAFSEDALVDGIFKIYEASFEMLETSCKY